MALTHFVILSVFLTGGFAEVANFRTCKDVSTDHCSVTAVRITPCENPSKCVLPRAQNATLSFDFTPNFSTSNLKTMVYYNAEEFAAMAKDSACQYTTCPTTSGVAQTFEYKLYIGAKLPPGTYPIEWKVWNGDSDDQVCCYSTTIKLKKAKKTK